MATFYLLPSRPLVGQRLANFLETWLPGLHCSQASWSDLAEGFGSLLNRQTESYVVFREDIPADEDLTQALIDGYGADEGDEVIELAPDFWPGDPQELRWQIARNRAA